jgi:hypothetical protein
MPASKSEPALSVENPSALIRSRIREKRIFEARFLCRQLSAELGGPEKDALTRELSQLQDRVEKLQQRARACVALGEYQQANALYRDIELIAIDVPGLDEEKNALEGAAAIIAKIAGKAVEHEPKVLPRASAPTESPKVIAPSAAVNRRPRRLPRLWLVVGVLGMSLLVILLFSLRRPPEEKPLAVAPEPSQVQPAQKIFINPLVPGPSAPLDQPDQEVSPAGTSSSPSSSVQVGTLQVKESARE